MTLSKVKRRAALICTTYNCVDELQDALTMFSSDENIQLLSEIVIVDGGSVDGTWELLEKWAQKVPKLKAYRVPGANISRGRNEAIKRTDAEIIVTFDSGTNYSHDWLKLMLEPFEDDTVKVVGGLTVACGETMFARCWAAFSNLKENVARKPSHRGCAFYREVWEKIGGYPEHVHAGEDTWFNTQWEKMGFKYVNVPQAKSFWKVRSTWGALFKMQRRNAKGHVTLGEPSDTWKFFFITSLYLFMGLCFIGGFYNYNLWYVGIGIYVLYTMWRLLCKGRWRIFVNPIKLLVGWYALIAFDLGMTLGTIEGTALFLKHKITGKKKKGNTYE